MEVERSLEGYINLLARTIKHDSYLGFSTKKGQNMIQGGVFYVDNMKRGLIIYLYISISLNKCG
jgi:hypothetical protein